MVTTRRRWPGSSVGTSVRLKSERSPVRSRSRPPQPPRRGFFRIQTCQCSEERRGKAAETASIRDESLSQVPAQKVTPAKMASGGLGTPLTATSTHRPNMWAHRQVSGRVHPVNSESEHSPLPPPSGAHHAPASTPRKTMCMLMRVAHTGGQPGKCATPVPRLFERVFTWP